VAGRLAVKDHVRVEGTGDGDPWLWAIGDITGHGGFTHLSTYQADVALRDILRPDPQPAEHQAVPSVTFTDPEVAAALFSRT